jgi:actin-related protein
MDDDDDDELPCVVIDVGSREIRCGWNDEDGPAVVLPGVDIENDEELRARLRDAFDALEVDESQFMVLLSEMPGATAVQREALATAVFEEAAGARAVHVVAAPLLALSHTQTETGVLIDVGERATYILPGEWSTRCNRES